jgi:hypothetical protein
MFFHSEHLQVLDGPCRRGDVRPVRVAFRKEVAQRIGLGFELVYQNYIVREIESEPVLETAESA